MGGIFHVCNPYCGYCKPPKQRPRLCSKCHKAYIGDNSTMICEKCGADLPTPETPTPRFCHIVQQMCANPCGKGTTGESVDSQTTCIYHTPLLQASTAP